MDENVKISSTLKKKSYQLQMLDGERKVKEEYSFDHELALGRATGDVIINDPLVSRLHCSLTVTGEVIRIEDLHSTNGVYVRITEPYELKSGDEFRIGQKLFRVVEAK